MLLSVRQTGMSVRPPSQPARLKKGEVIDNCYIVDNAAYYP